ncbi:MBL fold hydrolase [Spirochaetia bacterium]|nr:MBL fold hydrolase [Spirochaetia bacterium]
MAITFHSLGAAEEVTGSKHILEIDGRSYLIDCGAFQGSRAEADRKNRNMDDIAPQRIEAAILTHGHFDHCGMLPLLSKQGYNGNIYTTPATRDIANLIMMDSANIQARDAVYLRKQAQKKGEKFTWEPLYNEKDAIQAANQMMTASYNRPQFIGDGVKLEFFDAGHILGSSMAYITVNSKGKETRILASGDLGRKGMPIIRDPAVPPAPDYIILESTYGDRRHDTITDAMGKLGKIALKAVQNKGKIIIPAFAIERTQELVYYFHLLVDDGIIPELPIFVDSPMATNATTIYQVHPECYDEKIKAAFIAHHKNPFGFNSLHFTTSVEESKALNEHPGPLIIISADGMCEAGRIQHHLIHNIEDPNTTILTVGYMAQNTLGRRIRNKEPQVRIHGDWYKRRAEVEEINAFSAHADYVEATEWLKSIDTSRLKKIFLVHGEKKAQAAFTRYLQEAGFPPIQIVRYGETYTLD